MPQTPNLLNDDKSASMATMLLLSHHAFRRDIARLIAAVAKIKSGDASHTEAVRNEWEKSYRQALHGHHTAEDTNIFPDLRSKHPELATALDKLTAQHHQIDPIIEQGDAAFANLTHPEEAEAVLHKLKELLDQHLTFEEAEITPSLRDSKEFPAPANEEMANMYAQGFAWSMQGIAPEVLTAVKAMLPQVLVAKLSAAQAAFEKHSHEVWGMQTESASTTSIPEGY